MIITAPITDYIPASVLTTAGDLVVRGVADPERLAGGANNRMFEAQGAGVLPAYTDISGTLNYFLKGAGAGNQSTWHEGLLRAIGVHIGNNTRNAGGGQVITGVGFKPSVIIFLCCDETAANLNFSIGFSDGTTHMCFLCNYDGTNSEIDLARCMRVQRDATNYIVATISAIGADGFTITWSLTNVCVVDFIYLCLP